MCACEGCVGAGVVSQEFCEVTGFLKEAFDSVKRKDILTKPCCPKNGMHPE